VYPIGIDENDLGVPFGGNTWRVSHGDRGDDDVEAGPYRAAAVVPLKVDYVLIHKKAK
jgi:hypothetical protein